MLGGGGGERQTGNQNSYGPLNKRTMPSNLGGKLTSNQKFINRQTVNQYEVSTLTDPNEFPEVLREGCKSLR